MKTTEPVKVHVDSTAEQSWKIWQECGRRLQEQYDLGLMPPPCYPIKGSKEPVRRLRDSGPLRFEGNR